MKLVIAEKPSVAISLAAVLGAKEKKDGYLEGVGSAHDVFHALVLHQPAEKIKLLFLVLRHSIFPALRQDRKILIAPLAVLLAVGVRLRQLQKVSEAPAHKITAALQIPVFLLDVYKRQALRHGAGASIRGSQGGAVLRRVRVYGKRKNCLAAWLERDRRPFQKRTQTAVSYTHLDGIAESGLLYLGKYRLEEREAPYGCVLNEKPEYVELSYAGETVEVTEQSISLYDERQKAGLDLTKAMEKDELFKICLLYTSRCV